MSAEFEEKEVRMTTLKNAGTLLASLAGAASVTVLIAALAGLVERQTDAFGVLVAAQAAVAAAVLLPIILGKLNDHETLSVYRAMSAERH